MRKYVSVFVFLFCHIFLCVEAASEASILKDEMLRNVEFIASTFRASYAPKAWKKEIVHWDLESEVRKIKTAIEKDPKMPLAQYHDLLQQFFNAVEDYHVGIKFYSTERASLPFLVKGVKGKYYIVDINRKAFPKERFSVCDGDELKTFGGRPTAEVVAEMKKGRHAGRKCCQYNDKTESAMAERMLTRRGRGDGEIPKGGIGIEVVSKITKKVQKYILQWGYTPEKIRDVGTFLYSWKGFSMPEKNLFDLYTSYEVSCDEESIEQTPRYALGEYKSFLPTFSKDVTRIDNETFYAYHFKLEDGKRIGYLRIPNYRGRGLRKFSEIIKELESNTDALIIDQLNNPGGSIYYMYGLLGVLTDIPMDVPMHSLALTQKDVEDAIKIDAVLKNVSSKRDAERVLGRSFFGVPVDEDFAAGYRGFAQHIIKEWNAGKTFASPCYHSGIKTIRPLGWCSYTKPILVLINEMDFSGGDFFPAILQDSKRAVLFGAKTAGAGGYTFSVTYPNIVGIKGFSLTGSIAFRKDGRPIENFGATPDISYDITVDDLQNDYRGYVSKVLTTVKGMCK
jgi:hypothetical protein